MFKKVTFLFLMSLLFGVSAYAGDIPQISGISYTGNLSDNTVVDIRGSNLEKCSNLRVGDKEIRILEKSNTSIKYTYGDSGIYSGIVYLECEKGNINSSFSFPYINNITGYNGKSFDRNVTISGENFSDRSSVRISGGRFLENAKTNSLIIGQLPEDLSSSKIYIEDNRLKSNIIDLGIKIPEITFIYGVDAFKKGTNARVFGNNLNYYDDFKLYVGDTEITSAKYLNGYIEFELPNKIGDIDIRIKSNNIFSNLLRLNIKGGRPFIERVEEIEIEVRGNKQKALQITATNLSSELRDNKFELNGSNLRVSEINGNKAITTNYQLLPGDNTFSVDVNNAHSPIFIYSNGNISLPSVGGYELGPVRDGRREFRLFLNNFDKEYDDIYLGTRKQNILGCFGNMCRIELPENTLEGYFTAGRGKIINQNRVFFDLVYENTPYITDIRFSDELRQGTRVTISGGNFDGANIRATNLFRSEGRDLDVSVSNNTIEGRIPINFDSSSRSSINITNKGQSINFQFVGDDIGDKRVLRGAPLINKVLPTSDDGLIREGDKVKLAGRGFYFGDIVNIGNTKTDLMYESGEDPYFIMPRMGNYGELTLNVTNRDGQQSNNKSIMLFRQNDKKEITLSYKSIDNSDFIVDDTNLLRNSLYNLSLSNRIEDLVIRDMTFSVYGIEDFSKLGSFVLNVGRDNYGPVVINSEGKILFNDIFIEKSSRDIDISLNKKSPFIEEKTFDIGLYEKGFIVNDLSSRLFEGLSFRNISSNNISVSLMSGDNCIDTESTNINCNSYISRGVVLNNQNVNNTIDVEEKQVEIIKDDKVIDTKKEDTIKKQSERKTVQINKLNFRTTGMQNLNRNFDNLAQRLVNLEKNNGKEEDIRRTVNALLTGLLHFENSKDGDSRRTLAINILVREVNNLKKYL